MMRSTNTVIAVIAAACCSLISTAAFAAELLSLPEFAASKAKWSGYAASGIELRLEGRYSTKSNTSLRFDNCELSFQADSPSVLSRIRPDGTKKNVEVIGHMTKKDGKLVFIVEKASPTSSDVDNFDQKRRALRKASAADWYELGDWARIRGAYYKDDELKKRTGEAYQSAITLEYNKLTERTPAALLGLAKKANEYSLSASLSQEYIHEAYRVEWNSLRSNKPLPANQLSQKLVDFENRLATALAGARTQLPAPQPNLEKSYREDPIHAYQKGSADARPRLHRLFDIEVVLFGIERTAKPDGSNGWGIGERIDKALPDRHDLAEKYRERQLEFDFGRIAVLSQDEAVALAARYRDRNRPDMAKSTFKSWLEARRRQIRDNDAESLRQLGEQYEALLDDGPTAIHFLMEAYKVNPESAETAAALNDRGFQLKDGQWQTEAQIKNTPRDPLEEAMKQGIVVPEMTMAQVRGARGGEPTTTVRIATADTLDEIWLYRDGEKTLIAVHFQRRRGKGADDARVVATY